jgi:hypothetical protein
VNLRDWKYLKFELDNAKWMEGLLFGVYDRLPSWFPIFGHLSDVTASRNEKRAIYILSSFIEAHEHAQSKIRAFMGHSSGIVGDNESDDEGSVRETLTPEEKIVVAESQSLVSDV